MTLETLAGEAKRTILTAQRDEITEHFIYEKLSRATRDPHNSDILNRISNDELGHYNAWKKYTGEDVTPDKLKIWKYFLVSRIFGLTFGIKLMEQGEENAQARYGEISKFIPAAEKHMKDEERHEKQLIDMIDEERLKYVSSMVLGLNDALVELTGTLAGLTFALQNTKLIATVGSITGIAAALSMAASEYLSTKSEESDQDPLKASIYTGSAYILTVLFLISPFLLIKNMFLALGSTFINAIIVIFVFTFYISVAKDISFRKRFSEMAVVSFGIATVTFFIGFLVRTFLGTDM